MAIGEKVLHFQDKHINSDDLESKIEQYLSSDGFTTQKSADSEHGTVIQARKGKFLASLIDADRALTIMLSGSADDFVVRIGIGKWLEHLGIAVVETLLISDLFLVVDVAESAWNLEIEDKLAKQVESFVG